MIETLDMYGKTVHICRSYNVNTDETIVTIVIFDKINGNFVVSRVGDTDAILREMWFGIGHHYGMVRANKNAEHPAD